MAGPVSSRLHRRPDADRLLAGGGGHGRVQELLGEAEAGQHDPITASRGDHRDGTADDGEFLFETAGNIGLRRVAMTLHPCSVGAARQEETGPAGAVGP